MRWAAFVRFAALAIPFHALAPYVSAQQLRATQVVAGLSWPIGVRAAPGDVHRLFVLERAGTIRIVKDGALLAAPFLDITSEVSTFGEGGLIGLAFHPDYSVNGRFFVSFINSTHHSPLVREYHVSVNPDQADATSGQLVFGPQPWSGVNHYASDLHFGPDGMLYYSLGDDLGFYYPQMLGVYPGKMLRMNVDIPSPHVPVDNPFAQPNDGALDLIWSFGFRNPFRFSFDRLTGDLYIADVGWGTVEEVDFQPASFGLPGSPSYRGGLNYGWACMEGSTCTDSHPCVCDPSGATLVLPVYETFHNHLGSAIIGGFVYRGSAIPGLQGQYFCADITQNTITSFLVSNGRATQVQDRSAELSAGPGGVVSTISSFGQDANGEIYFTTFKGFGEGQVFRIDPITPPCPAPVVYCVTSPNSVGSGAAIGSTGSASIAASELNLLASHCPHHVPGFFFYGTQEVANPLGNGVRCVGGTSVRLPVTVTDEHGFVSRPFDAAAASLAAGQTRYFQYYYRDSAGGGDLFNLSDGLSVLFCP
jgi:glucose/arabinose dehydrogenase